MKSQCDKIRSELDRFLDEDLPNRDRLRVAEHLKNCPDCRAELERERQLMDAMAELPRLRCPERVIQQIERDICQQIERDICQGIERNAYLGNQRSSLTGNLRAFLKGPRWRWASVGFAALTAMVMISLWHPFGRMSERVQPPFSQEEIRMARGQVKWSLAYVVQTMDHAQRSVMEDILKNDLPQMTRNCVRDAVPAMEGGK